MIVLKIIGWVLLSILVLILLILSVRVRIHLQYTDEGTIVSLGWLFIKIPLYPAEKSKKKTAEESHDAAEEPAPVTEEQPEETPALPEAEPESAHTEQETQSVPSDEAETATEGTAEELPAPTEEEKAAPKKKPSKYKALMKSLYDAHGVDGLIDILKRFLSYTRTFSGNFRRSIVIDELYLAVACTRSDAAATAIYYGEVCAVLFPLLGALASLCRWKKYDVNVYPDYIARFSEVSFVVSMHLTPIYIIGVFFAYGIKVIFGAGVKLFAKPFLSKKSAQPKGQKEKINTTEKGEDK